MYSFFYSCHDYLFGIKWLLDFLSIVNSDPLRAFNCLVRDCFALKWFRPDLRAITFPFFVTFSLFVNDLFVFIFAFIFFYY